MSTEAGFSISTALSEENKTAASLVMLACIHHAVEADVENNKAYKTWQ